MQIFVLQNFAEEKTFEGVRNQDFYIKNISQNMKQCENGLTFCTISLVPRKRKLAKLHLKSLLRGVVRYGWKRRLGEDRRRAEKIRKISEALLGIQVFRHQENDVHI
jgi:hypothetical protein